MPRLTRVTALDGFRLALEFADGVTGVVEIEARLFGPVFEPLSDPAVFRQVALDGFGAPCWPNGADLAPDALHLQLQASQRAASSGVRRA